MTGPGSYSVAWVTEGRIGAQVDYYRARAPAYDDFWFHRGAYQLDPPLQEKWFLDAREAEEAVRNWVPDGAVLELACGTGIWTRLLVRRVSRVMAVDSAPEMIELNRERTAAHSVEFVVADLFSWSPPRQSFNGVFMGYWHSHIPDEHLDNFWKSVRSALRPGGRVMVLDSCPYPPGTPGDDTSRAESRTLDDGRRYEIIKRNWAPDDFEAALTDRGWHVHARTTTHAMILVAELEPR